MRSVFSRRAAALLSALLAALLLLCALPACGKDKEVPIGLIVAYNGPEVTTTDHVFEKSDFTVIASYEDGHDEYPSDFEFEQVGLDSGYYVLRFSYDGFETESYVRCNVAVYPSDMEP